MDNKEILSNVLLEYGKPYSGNKGILAYALRIWLTQNIENKSFMLGVELLKDIHNNKLLIDGGDMVIAKDALCHLITHLNKQIDDMDSDDDELGNSTNDLVHATILFKLNVIHL